MDGWMDEATKHKEVAGWMDGWMDDVWMDGWMDVCVHACGWMDVDGCMWMDGCMYGWMDGCGVHA